MNVYAHYLGNDYDWNLSKDGFQYRWRTILQFGNSWNVIGSVLMKNPGSAKPLQTNLSEVELKALASYDNSNAPWYRFTSDNTMQNIEKLFIARYNGKTLDGVIQIFNLFNIRNADLDKAIKSSTFAKEEVLSTINDDIEAMRQHNSPIYIGWGMLGTDLRFKDKANRIFQFVRNEMKQEYLFPKFEDNRFYHPLYLMGRGKNRAISQSILKAFCINSVTFNLDGIKVFSISTPQLSAVINSFKRISIASQWYDKNRYVFYPGLQATFDKTTINIRFTSKKNNGYHIADYQSTHEMQTIDVLINEYGYLGPEKVWVGRKMYSDFGYCSVEIASKIKEELDQIAIDLQNKGIKLC